MKPSNENSKDAKFFCESCGSEVPRKSKFCPACGKFFASVRCPECGKIGSSEDFKNGCPQCGYAVKGKSAVKNISNLDRNIFNGKGIKNNKNTGVEAGPPAWAYIVSVIVLAVLIVALYSCL